MDLQLGFLRLHNHFVGSYGITENKYNLHIINGYNSEHKPLLYIRNIDGEYYLYFVELDKEFSLMDDKKEIVFKIDQNYQIIPFCRKLNIQIDNKFKFIRGEDKVGIRFHKDGKQLEWCMASSLSTSQILTIIEYPKNFLVKEKSWTSMLDKTISLQKILSLHQSITLENFDIFSKFFDSNFSDLKLTHKHISKTVDYRVICLFIELSINTEHFNRVLDDIYKMILYSSKLKNVDFKEIKKLKEIVLDKFYESYQPNDLSYKLILYPHKFIDIDVSKKCKKLTTFPFDVLSLVFNIYDDETINRDFSTGNIQSSAENIQNCKRMCEYIITILNNGFGQNYKREIIGYSFMNRNKYINFNFKNKRRAVTFEQCIDFLSRKNDCNAPFFNMIRKRMVELGFDMYSDEHLYKKIKPYLAKIREMPYDKLTFIMDGEEYISLLRDKSFKKTLLSTNFKYSILGKILQKSAYSTKKFHPSDIRKLERVYIAKLFIYHSLKINADKFFFMVSKLPNDIIVEIMRYY